MIVWKQHLARKCYCHPPLLGLLLFSSLVPITTSLIRLPSSAIFNRTWFLSLLVIFALFHISFSMLYSEFFQLLLLLLFLRCVRVLDFVVLAAQSGFKNHPAFKWLYWNEKNTSNTPSSIIFSVQFPIQFAANHFVHVRRSLGKKLLCLPLFLITLGTRQKLKPGCLFLSLKQPRMRQNEGSS